MERTSGRGASIVSLRGLSPGGPMARRYRAATASGKGRGATKGQDALWSVADAWAISRMHAMRMDRRRTSVARVARMETDLVPRARRSALLLALGAGSVTAVPAVRADDTAAPPVPVPVSAV